jgi:hypothetical protein
MPAARADRERWPSNEPLGGRNDRHRPTAVTWGLFVLLEEVEEAGRDLPDREIDSFVEAAEAEIGIDGLLSGWATVGLLRAADPLPRPPRRADRAADPADARVRVLGLWWEEGFRPVAQRASSMRWAWRSARISASRALTGWSGRHTSTRRSGSSAAREVGDCRTALAGADPISWNPSSVVVLAAEPCRLVQIGFPGAGFRRLRLDLVLMRLLPSGAIPGAAPERPSGRRPTWT